ncbi:hypothetical protein bas06_0036 [Escherichia phage KarlJaspers]|uniref:Prophage protein n=2 Tax=Hanrivervirus TaxID=2560145 RepID=A0AAE7VVN8_9CAUD|nr:hypothetical protein bas06_0036 [Escherichia phage KarlJaspers]
MRDLTLKFADKAEFSAFLEEIEWNENESIQDAILLDVIGNTYTVVSVTEEGEEIVEKNDGYFVNARIINDNYDAKLFNSRTVVTDQKLREWA